MYTFRRSESVSDPLESTRDLLLSLSRGSLSQPGPVSLKFRPPVTEDAVEICSTPLTRELLGLPCVRILAVLLQDRLHFQGVTLITFCQIAIFQGTNLMIHMRLEDSKQSISYRDLRSDRSHIQTIQVPHWSLVRSLTGLVVDSPNRNAVLPSVFVHEAFQECLPRSPRRETELVIPVTHQPRKTIAEQQAILRIRRLIK